MAHLNPADMRVLAAADGSNISLNGALPACEICPTAKSARTAQRTEATSRTTALLELCHMDMMGPIETESSRGNLYLTSITDDFSRRSEVYCHDLKKDPEHLVEEFITSMAVPNSLHLRRLRSDNAGEYISAAFRRFADRSGFVVQHSAPHSQAQDGVAERYNRTLMTRVRCVLAETDLPAFLWDYICEAVAHIINLSPTRALAGTRFCSPLHCWHGVVPDLTRLRVLGAYVFVHMEKHKKLGKRSWRGRMVGFPPDGISYRVYSAEMNRVFETRHVTFIETPAAPLATTSDRRNTILPTTIRVMGPSPPDCTF